MKSLAFLSLCGAALAGEKTTLVSEPGSVPPWSLKLDSAWVGEGDYDKGGSGSVSESRVQLATQRRLSWPTPGSRGGEWVLRLGAEWERFGFSHSGGPSFLPGTLQSVSGLIGLEYRVQGVIGALVECRPGLFFEHHATLDSFDIPIRAAVGIPMGDFLAFVVGVTYAGDRKSPVIPIAGVWWKISDRLTLKAIPPDPRIEYKLNDRATVWLGGEFAGGSFRTDAGRDDALNAAVVSYTDYRVAAGGAWTLADGWSLEAGAGASLYRKWDFHRAEVGVKTDDVAPFVKFSLRGQW